MNMHFFGMPITALHGFESPFGTNFSTIQAKKRKGKENMKTANQMNPKIPKGTKGPECLQKECTLQASIGIVHSFLMAGANESLRKKQQN